MASNFDFSRYLPDQIEGEEEKPLQPAGFDFSRYMPPEPELEPEKQDSFLDTTWELMGHSYHQAKASLGTHMLASQWENLGDEQRQGLIGAINKASQFHEQPEELERFMAKIATEGQEFGTALESGDYVEAGLEGLDFLGETLWEGITNPKGMVYAQAEQAANLAATWIPGIALGKLGATGGAVVGGPAGASVGGAGGFLIGAGAGSFLLETGAQIREFIAQSGADPADPQAVYEALNDPQLREQWLDNAEKKGISIAAFDAAANLLGLKLLKGAKGPMNTAIRATGALGAQVGAAGAGEYVGQTLATGEVSYPEMGQEVALELLGPGMVDPILAANAARGYVAPGAVEDDIPSPVVKPAAENVNAIDQELERYQESALHQQAEQARADMVEREELELEQANKIDDIQQQSFPSHFHALVAHRQLMKEVPDTGLETVQDLDGSWVLRQQSMADALRIQHAQPGLDIRPAETGQMEVEEIPTETIEEPAPTTEGIEVTEIPTEDLPEGIPQIGVGPVVPDEEIEMKRGPIYPGRKKRPDDEGGGEGGGPTGGAPVPTTPVAPAGQAAVAEEVPLGGERQEGPTAGFHMAARTNEGEVIIDPDAKIHAHMLTTENMDKLKPDEFEFGYADAQGKFYTREEAYGKIGDVEPDTAPAVEPETAPEQTQDQPGPQDLMAIVDQLQGRKMTPAMQEANNYKKGDVKWQELDLRVETVPGEERVEGKPSVHFVGDIQKTKGADGDKVDVILNKDNKPNADSPVFVVNQYNPETGAFDEHKVMLGFGTKELAKEGYLGTYDEEWFSSIHRMPRMSAFKLWLEHGDNTTEFKPVEWGRQLNKLRKQQHVEGHKAFLDETGKKSVNYQKSAAERYKASRKSDARTDDLVTFLRKEGGVNMENQSDIPAGRYKGVEYLPKIAGLPGIDQFGDKGMNLDTAAELAWQNDYIEENNIRELVDLMYEAEGGPVYSRQNTEYMKEGEMTDEEFAAEQAEQDAEEARIAEEAAIPEPEAEVAAENLTEPKPEVSGLPRGLQKLAEDPRVSEIVDERSDDNGYWVYLNDNWKSPSTDTGSIHEMTIKDVLADFSGIYQGEPEAAPEPEPPSEFDVDLDDVLASSQVTPEGKTPLDQIKLTAEAGDQSITHTAKYWVNAIDKRIRAVNKLRGCA